MARIRELRDACVDFFEKSNDRAFTKSYTIEDMGERDGVLPALKWFLGGWFGDVQPEARAHRSNKKRVDFEVAGVAVEVAVRSTGKSKSVLKRQVNASEIKKLMRWGGRSALVLFDYSGRPLAESDLEAFRDYPSLGKGNFKRNPFNILYIFIDGDGVKCVRKVVRIQRKPQTAIAKAAN